MWDFKQIVQSLKMLKCKSECLKQILQHGVSIKYHDCFATVKVTVNLCKYSFSKNNFCMAFNILLYYYADFYFKGLFGYCLLKKKHFMKELTSHF